MRSHFWSDFVAIGSALERPESSFDINGIVFVVFEEGEGNYIDLLLHDSL